MFYAQTKNLWDVTFPVEEIEEFKRKFPVSSLDLNQVREIVMAYKDKPFILIAGLLIPVFKNERDDLRYIKVKEITVEVYGCFHNDLQNKMDWFLYRTGSSTKDSKGNYVEHPFTKWYESKEQECLLT
jgi:hypothetical protein